jgi:phage major head subunit gpT-like protein
MALNTASYTAVQNDLTQRFRLAGDAATPFFPTLCTEIPSTRKSENYGFLGSVPGMQEWLGDRKFKQLRAGRFSIENKPWESSLEVLREDIDDDNLGGYQVTMSELGMEAAYHPDELLVSSIEAGGASECFDGQYFYDSDHAWGDSGTQSNLLTYAAATGTTPTAAEFKSAYNAAVVALLGFKNDQGKLLNRPIVGQLSNLVVVVPLAMREVAHDALTAAVNASGATNVIIDRPQIVVMPSLSNAARFWVFNTDGAIRPFVFQKRQPLNPQWKGMEDREFKTMKFMVDARYNMGYFGWWKTVQSTFT